MHLIAGADNCIWGAICFESENAQVQLRLVLRMSESVILFGKKYADFRKVLGWYTYEYIMAYI